MDKDKQGGDVFIVDNSDADWKVRRYLHDWADLAHAIDIATGYFEIGGLLALDGQWQKVDKFRVLMGDEVSLRTRKAFTEALKTAEARLDESIEREKETNDFLTGVPAIVDASSEVTFAEAEHVLATDTLFKALVVQRSRAYVKKSQEQQGGNMAIFPTREPPKVATYSVKKTYGRLLDTVEQAFHKGKPLFVLGIYYPYAYYKGPDESIDPFDENRQKQVCGLIRTQFLKRFESSAYAFEQSCNRLLLKLLTWADRHSETEAEKRRLERWKRQNAELIGYVHERQLQLWGEESAEDVDEDLITEEMLEAVEYLERDAYHVEDILADTFLDLDEIVKFLAELKKFKSQHDDKLKALIKLLRTDPVMKRHKVLIFTEFAETARYLKAQLDAADVPGVEQIDSGSTKNRSAIIRRFAPYYNGSSSNELAKCGEQEIRILISTDVLSEGLNLQDATRMINYDLHWNPVRLMQRIGRVDRRMNPHVEEQIVAEHPDQQTLRGKVAFWNFLPPDELEMLLRLYGRVSHKTLQISKTLGIEGRKLLTPEDDYQALRDFNHTYEGETTSDEAMRLELQALLDAHEGLAERIDVLPGRVFSGRRHPSEGTRAVFFCYRLPRPDYAQGDTDSDLPWTEEAGETRWYLYDLTREKIYEEPAEIIDVIRTTPDTPRHCEIAQPTLSLMRKKVENHVKNTFLKRMQAPIGVKPILKAWTDLNAWREQWSSVFTLRHREVITTSQQLAVRLADLSTCEKLNSYFACAWSNLSMRKYENNSL